MAKGSSALDMQLLKCGPSGLLFVPRGGSEPKFTPAGDGNSPSDLSSPGDAGQRVPLSQNGAVGTSPLPRVSHRRTRSRPTQHQEDETQQNYQETTWSTETSDLQDLTLRDIHTIY